MNYKNTTNNLAKMKDLVKSLEQLIIETIPMIDNNISVEDWVIHKDKNKFFQYLGTNNDSVFLLRMGEKNVINKSVFQSDYRLAGNDEIEQHLEYLRRYSNDPSINMALREFMHQEISKPTFDPLNADFYIVTCADEYVSKVRHNTYESAEAEAIRLCKEKNQISNILGVVATVKPQENITTIVTKK